MLCVDQLLTYPAAPLELSWLVARNIRGWTQVAALWRLDVHFARIMKQFFIAVPDESHALANAAQKKALLKAPLATLRISSQLIDNNVTSPTPWLNPIEPTSRAWTRALWLSWWTQDTAGRNPLRVADTYNLELQNVAFDLPEEHWPEAVHAVDTCQPSHPVITTMDEWVRALMVYGDEPVLAPSGQRNPLFPGSFAGMQDTAGTVQLDRPLLDTSSTSGIVTLVYEKTAFVPHRMASLWYGSSIFSDRYAEAAPLVSRYGGLRMPSLASWRRMAIGIGESARVPLFLSGADLENYACELASASMLLALYPTQFKELVDQIYEDGRKARWTFGWSGLLSCFSNVWTRERVFVAAANGLSLLSLRSATTVARIPDCVRSMLVAYVSSVVSQRAVGRRIASLQQQELLRRYRYNRGRTCRGSGVDAIRRACNVLGLPAVASHMDGLPAFMAGWCLEYMVRQPGNQPPEHGEDHEEVERRLGSGTAWRYLDCPFR